MKKIFNLVTQVFPIECLTIWIAWIWVQRGTLTSHLSCSTYIGNSSSSRTNDSKGTQPWSPSSLLQESGHHGGRNRKPWCRWSLWKWRGNQQTAGKQGPWRSWLLSLWVCLARVHTVPLPVLVTGTGLQTVGDSDHMVPGGARGTASNGISWKNAHTLSGGEASKPARNCQETCF